MVTAAAGRRWQRGSGSAMAPDWHSGGSGGSNLVVAAWWQQLGGSGSVAAVAVAAV